MPSHVREMLRGGAQGGTWPGQRFQADLPCPSVGLLDSVRHPGGDLRSARQNFTDSMNAISPDFRRLTSGDPRRFYFPFMIFLLGDYRDHRAAGFPGAVDINNRQHVQLRRVVLPVGVDVSQQQTAKSGETSRLRVRAAVPELPVLRILFINFVADTFFGGPLVVF
jgi:hypothetical protein